MIPMTTDRKREGPWAEHGPPTSEKASFEESLARATAATRDGDAIELARILAETPALAGNLFWTAPLMERAAEFGQVGSIRVLLDAGVPPDRTNESGGTPLMEAAWNGHLEAARVLLAAGADPNVLVEDHCQGGDPEVVGRCALFFALANGHQELVDLLEPITRPEVRALANRELPAYLEWREKNPSPHEPTVHLFIAIVEGRLDRLREAIASRGDVNHRMPPEASPPARGSTPLSFAAATGRMDLVEALLQAGADPWLKSHDGRTPSDFADLNGHPEVAAALRAARWPPAADRG
jgi:hypothetical protein